MSERERLSAKDVLSSTTDFPNDDAARRLGRLVGVDDHVESLARDLALIYDPSVATITPTTARGQSSDHLRRRG